MILADRYNYPADFYEKSKEAFETAIYTAPAYKPWRAADPGKTAPICARYAAVPELTKQMIRDNFPAGLAPGHKDLNAGLLNGDVDFTFTSGTTGDRVVNIWDQNWWDRAEAASWKLNAHMAGMAYPQRQAKLASSLNVGVCCEDDLPMQSRTLGGKLYLNEKISLIQWRPRHYLRMAKELADFRPAVLEANPSLLARLAYWAIDEGAELYSPPVIVFTFEFVSKIHLAAIRKTFKSPLVSSFGTTETGFVMQECEAGALHQNTGFCRIDFHPLKAEFGGPELGRMLVTTFGNPWNYVVKFDTGDLLRLYPSGACPCGRCEGMIGAAIEGRTTNATFTTGGGLVTTKMLDDALAAVDGVRDYYMAQKGPSSYELSIMAAPSESPTRRLKENARDAIESLYGPGGVYTVIICDDLAPGPAGKFRRTQADFDFDWKGLFV